MRREPNRLGCEPRSSKPKSPRSRLTTHTVRWTSLALALWVAAVGSAEPNAPAGVDVKVHDSAVFRVLRAQGDKSAQERARSAAHALEEVVDETDVTPNVVVRGDRHVIMAGDTPVIELDQEDAAAAGDATLQAHSARLLKRTREVVKAEKQRSDIAHTVFSISLVVFFAVVSLFALRKLGELAERARAFVEENPDRVPAVRVQSLELVGAAPLRAALLAALFVGRFVLQVAVLYVWLAFSFSRFEATRPYTERLAGFVITPLFSLAERLLSALPLGLLALVSGVVVYVLVRFIELFFTNVRRGETRLPWLPTDLVLPVSVMARVGVVLLALVFAGPLVTGDPEGSLARAGAIVMLALAFSTTPLLASVVVGVMQVFSRRVRVGQELEVSGRHGRVTAVGLFDLRLRDETGYEVRVPHLLALLSPLRTRGADARTGVVLSVSASVQPSAVKALLLVTAGALGERPQVELQDIDAAGARFSISVATHAELTASDLRIALAEALQAAGMALGQQRPGLGQGDRPS